MLGSRNEKPLDRYFPELVESLLANLPDRCVLDGEIVIAGPSGLDFDALSQRIHPAESRVLLLSRTTPASFVAFDLLALGDHDLREEPFATRRTQLQEALAQVQSIHTRDADDHRSSGGAGLVLAVRGRRARRGRGQGGRSPTISPASG